MRRPKRIYEIAEMGAGLRVTRDEERVRLLVSVGAAGFEARLTLEQAHALGRALLSEAHDEDDSRRLRAVTKREA